MRPLSLILFYSFFALCSIHSAAQDINSEMQQASQSLTELMPFIYSDQEFRSSENKQTIVQNIDRLIGIIERTPQLLGDHAVTLEISQQSLLGSLKQAKTLYNTGSYATSQYLLSGVPIICSSCHIQDGQQASLTKNMDRTLFANDYSFAEFNYYLRNYSQAKSAYLAYLKIPATQASRVQAGKTLERLLDISLITAHSSQPALDLLDEALTLPKLDLEVKHTVAKWQQGLRDLDYGQQTLDALEKSIYATFDEHFTLEHEFIFNEDNRPKAVLWRLQLHKHLRDNPNTQNTARALYLLSILERTLGDQLDISLANMYLKECIRLNVKEYSGKCLNEYENHLYFYYGGSSGEHLPDAVLEELNQIKTRYSKSI